MSPPEPFLKWRAWAHWYIDWRYHQIVCLLRGHSWDDYYCTRCGKQ